MLDFDNGEEVMIKVKARHVWTNPYLMSDGKAGWVRTWPDEDVCCVG